MNEIAKSDPARRGEVFSETAARKNLPEAVVEKDFWVCWMLEQLFSLESMKDWLLFKGGTSLSKVFHAIERFSEDIDLAVDYRALGFVGERDPRHPGISKTRRAKIQAEMLAECQRFIASEFLTELGGRCEAVLGERISWDLQVDDEDPHVVRFHYPSGSKHSLPYVRLVVLLEIGTHAEFIPRGRFPIRSFVAEEFPALASVCEVTALLAKRTFWEKVTILHAEFHRPLERATPHRYSRHYYDVAMLSKGPVKAEALADIELLDRVVRHKQEFYPAGWASYETARVGSLRLNPKTERFRALAQDYRETGVMIFGEPPLFEEVLDAIQRLEQDINDR
ncbi:MAG: nucleotidyl transferase AbiEii/AbiGii toxin family protein [Bryobacterales bacterium]|nr:nucleotidyl transferase AbiEii/AbiGii toxin family protein [Bryobacterales bacterium]